VPLALQAEAVFFLLLAALLSAIIGINRERAGFDAGLRTHIIVGVGACLFTILSRFAFPGNDTARVASNIVVGIGFLGAGTIIRQENRARGLTTAAGIWVTAAVGMAVGTGAWLLACAASAIIWVVFVPMRHLPIERENRPE
jgi:putative Mg2+ transporter-C (MgtC) family protein